MLSIIIPTYNEEAALSEALGALPYGNNIEVIVADGQSTDRTEEFIRRYPALKLIQCAAKGRASQMNEAARHAKGEIFLFLHADCRLEKESPKAISQAIKNGHIGGCLSQRISSGKVVYRFIEASGNIRARLFKVFYGDQAIFVRRDVFFKLGGFDNLPLFEDILFSKKLMRAGETRVLDKKVFVSPRRWQKNGIIMTTIIFWLLTLGLSLGVSFDRLKRLYQDIR